ncbi:hypothetical protein [Helicobacter trogontum]|nr:hypothetical protein [Helicobacter trogontum]
MLAFIMIWNLDQIKLLVSYQSHDKLIIFLADFSLLEVARIKTY